MSIRCSHQPDHTIDDWCLPYIPLVLIPSAVTLLSCVIDRSPRTLWSECVYTALMWLPLHSPDAGVVRGEIVDMHSTCS